MRHAKQKRNKTAEQKSNQHTLHIVRSVKRNTPCSFSFGFAVFGRDLSVTDAARLTIDAENDECDDDDGRKPQLQAPMVERARARVASIIMQAADYSPYCT